MANQWWLDPLYQGFKWTPGNPRAHSGVDKGAPCGTPVVTPVGGTVLTSGGHPWSGQVDVLVPAGALPPPYDRSSPHVLSYLHLSREVVRPGPVAAGQQIGLSGQPPPGQGFGSGCHLHFEVTQGNTPPYTGYNPWYPTKSNYPVDAQPLIDYVSVNGPATPVNASSWPTLGVPLSTSASSSTSGGGGFDWAAFWRGALSGIPVIGPGLAAGGNLSAAGAAFGPLLGWATNPVRVFKVVVGAALIMTALWVTFLPQMAEIATAAAGAPEAAPAVGQAVRQATGRGGQTTGGSTLGNVVQAGGRARAQNAQRQATQAQRAGAMPTMQAPSNLWPFGFTQRPQQAGIGQVAPGWGGMVGGAAPQPLNVGMLPRQPVPTQRLNTPPAFPQVQANAAQQQANVAAQQAVQAPQRAPGRGQPPGWSFDAVQQLARMRQSEAEQREAARRAALDRGILNVQPGTPVRARPAQPTPVVPARPVRVVPFPPEGASAPLTPEGSRLLRPIPTGPRAPAPPAPRQLVAPRAWRDLSPEEQLRALREREQAPRPLPPAGSPAATPARPLAEQYKDILPSGQRGGTRRFLKPPDESDAERGLRLTAEGVEPEAQCMFCKRLIGPYEAGREMGHDVQVYTDPSGVEHGISHGGPCPVCVQTGDWLRYMKGE